MSIRPAASSSRTMPGGPACALFLLLSLLFFFARPIPAFAEEAREGTVIRADNLDEIGKKTFEGVPIATMIPDVFKWQIREKGLTLELAHAKPPVKDPVMEKFTRDNTRRVTFDEKSRRVIGWRAGVPFPMVDSDDPHAAIKVIWNLYYGQQHGDSQDLPNTLLLLVSGKAGIHTTELYHVIRVFLKGVLREKGGPVRGEGDILEKLIRIALAPQDIEGNGVYIVRHDVDRPDLVYLQLKQRRRLKRLSGTLWNLRIPRTNLMGDDIAIFSAYPTWYRSYRLIGKKKILAIANSRNPFWNKSAATLAGRFPGFNLAEPPFWNPVDRWEPREVYVIEAIPPEDHLYGRKLIYVDAENWNVYLGEFYNKSNSLWKTMIQGYHVFRSERDGAEIIVWPSWSVISDFNENHATILIVDKDSKFNSGIDPTDIDEQTMQSYGR